MASSPRQNRHDHPSAGWWRPLAVVSAVLVAGALVAALLLGDPFEPSEAPVAPLASRLGLAARAALAALGSDPTELETARAELLTVLETRGAELPADTRDTVAANLAIIGEQIEAISSELERDPDNPRLARLLAAAYQRELELLRRAAALAPGAPEDDEG